MSKCRERNCGTVEVCCAVKFSKKNFQNWLIRAAQQATPSLATAMTGACGHLLAPDRILMKFNYQHKNVGIPDCLMPLMAINDDVGNRHSATAANKGKLGISPKEGRYLRDVVRMPMGGQRGGPHRLVNPKIRAIGNHLPDKKNRETAYGEFRAQHIRHIPPPIPLRPKGSKPKPVPPLTGKVPPLTLLLAPN